MRESVCLVDCKPCGLLVQCVSVYPLILKTNCTVSNHFETKRKTSSVLLLELVNQRMHKVLIPYAIKNMADNIMVATNNGG